MSMTIQEAITSLKSTDCPGCGAYKIARRTVCSACWVRVSPPLRRVLGQPMSRAYPAAVDEALASLGRQQASNR